MGAPRCALTFDDGPDPVWTPAVLESLPEHRLRATFFVIGSRADLGEAGKHAHADPEPVGLAWRSNSRRTCSVVGGRNASSRARMASQECCFATAMRHRIAVRLATIAPAASTRAAVSAPSTRLPVLVHLNSVSKPASAGSDPPAERGPRCCFRFGQTLRLAAAFACEQRRRPGRQRWARRLCIRPAAGARHPAAGRSLRDECDHRASYRG
jgi:Polysaccharide deacetylase